MTRAFIHGTTLVSLAVAGVATIAATASRQSVKPRPAAAMTLPSPEQTVGTKLRGFKLPDSTGKARTLAEFKDRKALVIVFTGADCPISNSYVEALAKLSAAYEPRGVQFLAVNANPGEALAAVAKHAREFHVAFPVLKDADQSLANQLGARCTPEVFVLDAGRVLRYRGRIDSGYATRVQKRSGAPSPDLQLALDAVLAGKPVPVAVTQAIGCAIARPERPGTTSTARVTYHRDVEPILQERCQNCHRPGQIGPFSLLTFADAKNWAQEIKEFTGKRLMPPWKAEPGHGEFQGVRRLSDAEMSTLAAWADAGAPQGDPKDAPAPKQWPSGWLLGKPDLVLSMPQSFHVEASGDDVFHCFVLPTNLPEDKHVVAVEVRPGNPKVLHHVLNFIDVSGAGKKLDAADPGPGYKTDPGGVGFFPAGTMGGWAPGNLPHYLPDGVARLLPKGADLVLQVHYHKTGKPEDDQTSIGLYFAKEPPKERLRMTALSNFMLNIPPGEPRYEVKANMTLQNDVKVISITPHMHLLGKEMKVWATLPDGTKKEMVFVKDWDYRWQDSYHYVAPLELPKGTRLDLAAYYDNSTANPLNPNNPPKRVTFGEQTTDEMCFAFFELVVKNAPPNAPVIAPATAAAKS
jgi:peroxiredoxin